MVNSAKSRSKSVFAADTQNSGSSNDNNPGHELSDLDGVPRQPAGETVVHYARFAQIGSFPEHPSNRDTVAKADAPVMDASPEKRAEGGRSGRKRVTLACLGSAFFHMSLVLALAVSVVATPEEPAEEAGDVMSVIMLGDSEMDQAVAGNPEEELQPQPEEIVAEAVEPQTVQPTEVQPEEVQPAEVQPMETTTADVQKVAPQTAETVDSEQAEPSPQAQAISPDTVTAAEPEVLTSQAPAETSVVQPMVATVPDEVSPIEPQEPLEALPDPVPPTEVAVPMRKPQMTTPIEKPKEAMKKPPPKKVKAASGADGENKLDSKKGMADGTETAQSDQNSRAAGRRSGAGSAAVANYPGKVSARVRRSMRVPSEYKRMGAMTVLVRFTVGSSGALTSVSVARSSGVPALDQAALDGVRRAAPFPPIPDDYGKPSWVFTQPIQVTGR